MSDVKLISPMLDNFDMGDPISHHDGVRCCPAMEKNSDNKYIVKVISIPASQVQLDALLLTGAYPSAEAASVYFKELSDSVMEEAQTLQQLSSLEGFLPYEKWQTAPMDHGTGYHVYLLGPYRRTLEKFFRTKPMTHLGAVNLGLDLCAAMAVCRHSGYLYVDLKPSNVCLLDNNAYRVFDLGFVKLSGLKFASLPSKYISKYTAPEIADAFSSLNQTLDIYAIGLILYQAYNNGALPFSGERAPEEAFAPPAYADYEMSEIILKACAPDPKDRWQNPIDMGQALVSYMQRNGVNDTPIIPLPAEPVIDSLSTDDGIDNSIPANEEIPVSAPEDNTAAEDAQIGDAADSDPEIDELLSDIEDILANPTVEELIIEEEHAVTPTDEEEDSSTDIAEAEATEESESACQLTEPREGESSIPEAPEEDIPPLTDASADTSQNDEEESEQDAGNANDAQVALLAEVDDTSFNTDAPVIFSDPNTANRTEEDTVYSEDDLGNLSFLIDSAFDETAPGEDTEDIAYTEVTDEVSEILSQADDLIAHEAPKPAVAPDPIEVALPEPEIIEESDESPNQADASTEAQETDGTDDSDPSSAEEEIPDPIALINTEEAETDSFIGYDEAAVSRKKAAKRWIIGIVCFLLALALAAFGFYYYQNYYLQPVSLSVDGTENSLNVYVSSNVDESKLTVFCSDTYGNSLSSDVVNGKASFTNLAPGSGYTVTVEVNGFHQLTGDTATAYSTPIITNIVQLNTITGPENGSVIISFAIEGPDSQQWIVRCSADGEEDIVEAFSGHMVTVSGLTVGKEYTLTLESENSIYISGNYQTKWTACNIAYAQNLEIISCNSNKLTTAWNAPEGEQIEYWTVRCYNDSGFDETVKTTETSATFENLDHTKGYTVEVTAANMTVSERTYIAENSATVTGYSVDSSDPSKLILTWTTSQHLMEGNWILLYSADGMEPQEVSCSTENIAIIQPAIPDCEYTFTLLTTTGSYVFNSTYSYTTAEALKFSNYNVTADHMEINMCRTPDVENWDRHDLEASDYTTTFKVGEKASFLIRVRHEYNPLNDNILSMFVIRDSSGNIVKVATSEQSWLYMWYKGYCELDIPAMPDTEGNYTITLYFNGYFAGEREFTISNA